VPQVHRHRAGVADRRRLPDPGPLRPTVALIVDHRLQDGSDRVAARAAEQALGLGCQAAEILTVTVGATGGPEAAARTARNAALQDGRGGRPVLLGHTLDDQAETVLLGLGRGSGPRSIAGMRTWAPPWGRPLLGLRRAVTAAACAELGLTPWADPHNTDPRFTRVRLTDLQLRAVDALVTDWRGQGGVAVGGGAPGARLFAERRDGVLRLRQEPI
ncbi:tRNA lysidine(34) synthetase, partial [Mycolicibacterium fallax]|uniref:tRNA lysidine(34) synthetase n=1 Tax=Mycolicibacterium fallax TaxID=1793 RepID=UPI0023E04698